MDFSLTDEQSLLRESLSRFLRDRYTFEERTAATLSPQGWRPDIWNAFVHELGIVALGVPEAAGGVGGGAVEHMIVMEELGRALVLEPYLETAIIGAGLASRFDTPAAQNLLRAIVAGEAVTAFAWAEPDMRYDPADIGCSVRQDGDSWVLNGAKAVVAAAPWATHFLVAARTAGERGDLAGLSLFIVPRDAAGLQIFNYPTIDGRRASDLIFSDVTIGQDALLGEAGSAHAIVAETIDRAIAGLCAEAVGVMDHMLQDTIAYTKERRQFGQALADFQVLQHRMVDMFMKIEMARSATYLVTLRLDADAASRARAASAAKYMVGEAARFVGQNAVQLHGGMGMTDELALGHFFKRATVIESEFGTGQDHLDRHAELTRNAA